MLNMRVNGQPSLAEQAAARADGHEVAKRLKRRPDGRVHTDLGPMTDIEFEHHREAGDLDESGHATTPLAEGKRPVGEQQMADAIAAHNGKGLRRDATDGTFTSGPTVPGSPHEVSTISPGNAWSRADLAPTVDVPAGGKPGFAGGEPAQTVRVTRVDGTAGFMGTLRRPNLPGDARQAPASGGQHTDV